MHKNALEGSEKMPELPPNAPPLFATLVTDIAYQMKVGWFDVNDAAATLDGVAKTMANMMNLPEVPKLDPFTISVVSALYAAHTYYEADKANQREE